MAVRVAWMIVPVLVGCGGAASTRTAAPAGDAAELDACAAAVGVPEVRGVLAVPTATMRAALRPTVRAPCGCLPGGAAVDVRVRLFPERGRSVAELDEPALARCVAGAMGAGVIPAFALGSDGVGCGGVAAPTSTSTSTSTLLLPLRFVRP